MLGHVTSHGLRLSLFIPPLLYLLLPTVSSVCHSVIAVQTALRNSLSTSRDSSAWAFQYANMAAILSVESSYTFPGGFDGSNDMFLSQYEGDRFPVSIPYYFAKEKSF